MKNVAIIFEMQLLFLVIFRRKFDWHLALVQKICALYLNDV